VGRTKDLEKNEKNNRKRGNAGGPERAEVLTDPRRGSKKRNHDAIERSRRKRSGKLWGKDRPLGPFKKKKRQKPPISKGGNETHSDAHLEANQTNTGNKRGGSDAKPRGKETNQPKSR